LNNALLKLIWPLNSLGLPQVWLTPDL